MIVQHSLFVRKDRSRMKRAPISFLKVCTGTAACLAVMAGELLISSPAAYASSGRDWSTAVTKNEDRNGYHITLSLQELRSSNGNYAGQMRARATVVVPEKSTLPANIRLGYSTDSNQSFMSVPENNYSDTLVDSADTKEVITDFEVPRGSSVIVTLSLTDATGNLFTYSSSLVPDVSVKATA